ncbi:hypothetical protein FB107DRAFT_293307 [Schizophyllum commune]
MSVSVARVYQSVLQAISRALFSSSASPSAPSEPVSLLDLPNETLVEIAFHLDNRNLYAFLLVSKRLHAVAEPVLWRELSSLVPILRLLPEYFEREALHPTVKSSNPGTDLPHDIWERNPNIVRLANHVRKLLIHPISDINRDRKHATFYDDANCTSVRWHALQAVVKSIPPSSDFILFPRLQHLTVNTSFHAGLSAKILLPLVGPHVHTLEVHCPMRSLDHLFRRCDIRSFAYLEPSPTIYRRHPPVAPHMALAMPALNDMAHAIDKLYTLRLRLNYGNGLLPLLQPARTTLRVLDIEIERLAKSVTDYGLVNLRSLTVRSQRPAFVCALAGSTRLEAVALHDLIIRDADEFADVMNKLDKDTLRRVYIQERPPPRGGASWNLEARHLDPLTSCPNLLEIDIRASSIISITDKEWEALVPSWPRLQYLRVQPCVLPPDLDFWCKPRLPASPTATLAALIPISCSCRYLEELSIPIKMNEPVLTLYDDLILDQSHLTKFDLGEREIRLVGASTWDVVQFLLALFPELRHVKAVRTECSANDFIWDDVVEALASDDFYNGWYEMKRLEYGSENFVHTMKDL